MIKNKIETELHYAGLWRRIAAFAFDFLLIAAYILILLVIGLGLYTFSNGLVSLSSPLAVDGLSFIVLVLPVILYFAVQEGSSRQATWGKRRMKLKVVNAQGNRLQAWQTLLRSVFKVPALAVSAHQCH